MRAAETGVTGRRSWLRALARTSALAGRVSESVRADLRRWLAGADAELDPRCRLYAGARLQSLGGDPAAIRVGAHSHVRGELLVAAHGGRIAIGDWCYVGEGARVWSAAAVDIGDRVLIAHGCEIHDWDAHPLDAAERHRQFRQIVERGHPRELLGIGAAPVRIGDDAWIGFGAAVLKGVRIGARSVVAARSLVVDDVPDDTLVAGAPARVVRAL